MVPLKDKVVLITGAATGIGRATALRFGQRGAAVAVNHLPTTKQSTDAAEIVCAIQAGGGRATAIAADLADLSQLEHLFAVTLQSFGGLDILVNNAVTATLKPIAEISPEEFDRSMAVNARAPFFACQLCAMHMRDGGRIVNISSHTTALFFARYGLYDATKGALEQISRVFSKEIGHRGITVNVVSPGPTDSPEFRTRPPDFIRSLESMTAMGRIAQIDEVVNVIEFLGSDEASWITGQNLRVNGGAI